MYQIFFLPFVMQAAVTKSEQMEKQRNTRDLIYRRRLAEENFLETVNEHIGKFFLVNFNICNEFIFLGAIDLSLVNTNVFKVYDNNKAISHENSYLNEP